MIRSILEQASPVFSRGLSKTNIQDIEQIQHDSFKIILCGNYQDYNNALEVLRDKTRESRRESLSLKFAKSCLSHPKMSHLFQRKVNLRTRHLLSPGGILQEDSMDLFHS